MPVERRAPHHYVNNKEFSAAVVEYVREVNEADAAGDPIPEVPDYIAECFLKIAEGLSHKSNFVRYTYREEMVMDAVENCLKAVKNYNIDAATRTGSPNAFAYFTQISYYAFLRRLQREKRQYDIRTKFMEESGLEGFLEEGGSQHVVSDSAAFVDSLRERIDQVHVRDQVLKDFEREQKRLEQEQEQEPKDGHC
jgi:DNA-binding Lrp family transcriptional regulator